MAWIRMGGGGSKSKPKVVYIYNSGDECVDISGGWSFDGYSSTGGYSVRQGVKEATDLYCNNDKTDNCHQGFGTQIPIDLSGYSKIVVNGEFKYSVQLSFSVVGKKVNTTDWIFIDVGVGERTIEIPSDYRTSGVYIAICRTNWSSSQERWGKFKSIKLIPKTEPTYLYKDGTQNVAWDNNGYSLNASQGYVGEPVILTNSAIKYEETTNLHNQVLITENIIDLADYSKLVVAHTNGTKTIDISSVYNGYIYVGVYKYSGISTHSLHFGISTTKNSYMTNKISWYETGATTSPIYVTRVWLEN